MQTIRPIHAAVSKGGVKEADPSLTLDADGSRSMPGCIAGAGLRRQAVGMRGMARGETGSARPVVLAMLVGAATTACGMGIWHDRPLRQRALPVLSAAAAAPAFAVDSQIIQHQPGVVRSSMEEASFPQASRNQHAPISKNEPQPAPPEASEQPTESPRTTEQGAPSAVKEMPSTTLAQPTTPPPADVGEPQVLWLLAAGGGLFGIWLWRRRRRHRRPREAWTPILWGGPRLLRPHWEYDPSRYDSDAFIARWDSIPLNISGEWGLLLAIAGHALPRVLVFPGKQVPVPGAEDDEACMEMAAPESAAALAAAVADEATAMVRDDAPPEPAPSFADAHHAMSKAVIEPSRDGVASPVRAALKWLEESDAHLLPVPAPASDEPSHLIKESMSLAPEASTSVSGEMPPAVVTTPMEGTMDDQDWLADAGALLRSWEASHAPEAEQALWQLSQRLSARARALPQIARAPWLDTVEALAERMASRAPETARGAWRAHWVDLRLDRLKGMNGAWRLLELRVLHDACAKDTAREVLEARVRLLQVWAEALIGAAAKAKRAEAAALASELGHAQAVGA